MPIEDIDTSSKTLLATLVHCSQVSSAKITNNSYYYYSRLVLRSVAGSNATVGYQFTALASGKALWKAEGFSACVLQLQIGSQTWQEILGSQNCMWEYLEESDRRG